MRRALPYNELLAEAFCRTRIVVDVVNAPFIDGFSVKPLICFAAGGFLLTNRKADLVRALGPIANEVIYDNKHDLATKVDYFLSHDRMRQDLSQEIKAIVRREFTAQALFAKTLPEALDHLDVQSRA